MKAAYLFVVLAVFSIGANAQSDSTINQGRQPRYFSYFGSRVLLGKDGRGTTVSLSTIHGVRANSIAIGLGIGYDDYSRTNLSNFQGIDFPMRWKSVALFLSLSADWGKIRNNRLFIQLNGGYSFIRADNPDDIKIVEESKGGIMLNPALGYRIDAGKYRIYIGAGYKIQRNKYQYNPVPWIWGPPSGRASVKETMQRIEVRVGFGLH